MDDNLAPNAGADWYNEPDEQVAAQQDELRRRGDPQFVLQSIYEWFAEQAEECDHTRNINSDLTGEAYEIEAKALAKLHFLLGSKADEFREFEGSL